MSSAFEGLPKTPNLKLNKPGYDNVADIEALNENADILDAEIQGIKNTFVKSVNGKEPDAGGNVNVEKYTHPNSGVTAGTYRSVTVNAQGHVTDGSNPTLAIADGGTGATTAKQARTNLGIKDIATYDVLPIANGGTGANNASDACANIGALPTSGGTMTGSILFDKNNQIANTRDDAVFAIYGGVNFGGRLGLYGSNHPTSAGQAVLTTSISSEKHYSLVLDPTNREISWDGEEVPSIAYKDIKFNAINQQNVIRYRNGLQIIIGKINYSDLANGVLNFVLPFSTNQQIFLAFPLWGAASNVPKITANPITSTQATILVSESCYFSFLVIGRWK